MIPLMRALISIDRDLYAWLDNGAT